LGTGILRGPISRTHRAQVAAKADVRRLRRSRRASGVPTWRGPRGLGAQRQQAPLPSQCPWAIRALTGERPPRRLPGQRPAHAPEPPQRVEARWLGQETFGALAGSKRPVPSSPGSGPSSVRGPAALAAAANVVARTGPMGGGQASQSLCLGRCHLGGIVPTLEYEGHRVGTRNSEHPNLRTSPGRFRRVRRSMASSVYSRHRYQVGTARRRLSWPAPRPATPTGSKRSPDGEPPSR